MRIGWLFNNKSSFTLKRKTVRKYKLCLFSEHFWLSGVRESPRRQSAYLKRPYLFIYLFILVEVYLVKYISPLQCFQMFPTSLPLCQVIHIHFGLEHFRMHVQEQRPLLTWWGPHSWLAHLLLYTHTLPISVCCITAWSALEQQGAAVETPPERPHRWLEEKGNLK